MKDEAIIRIPAVFRHDRNCKRENRWKHITYLFQTYWTGPVIHVSVSSSVGVV